MEEKTFKLLNKAFILAAVLVVGVLIFFVGVILYQQRYLDLQNQYQITVSGEGKVYAKPDIAVISMGVTAQGATVAETTKTSTEKMNAIIDAVKSLGVEAKDIQTTNYNLYPRYETKTTYSPISSYVEEVYTRTSNNAIIGYALDQNIQVKIRDFEKIGDIISKATEKGANLVGSLQFTIDDPEQFREEARAKAIERAKENAKNLAEESGIRLGKIINVYENNYYAPRAYDATKGMGGASVQESVNILPTIEPGQQEINLTVSITYQVK
jgi:hypothetical protein